MPDPNEPPTHVPDQLIVDLEQLPYVQKMLNGLGVRHELPIAENADLGLARLSHLFDAGGVPVEAYDLLGLLRQEAAADRGGFTLTLGVNRLVDAVIGEGHKPMAAGGHGVAILGHKPIAGADPAPVRAAQIPPGPAAAPDAGAGVVIGMVDSPLPGPGPGTLDEPLPYRSGHATFVRSLISTQAPAAEIRLESALDATTGRADSWEVARAMARLAPHVDIINLSIGCFTYSGGPPLVIARAIERLSPEVLIVAAAGNHALTFGLARGRTARSACWPAAHPLAVAVGAMDGNGDRAEFSPRASWVRCQALGVDVVGSYLHGEVELNEGGIVHFAGFARWSGTSFSAATVSGLIAARTIPGSVTPAQALESLLEPGNGLVRPFPPST